MIELNQANLSSIGDGIAKPAYDRGRLSVGIVHFGVGNFHRVHEALAVEDCLAMPGNEGWAICGVGLTDSPVARAKAEAYRAQDGLYTVTELAPSGNFSTRVVGAMIEYLHAPTEAATVLERLVAPETRIVSMTITEGGYNLDSEGRFRLDEPDVAHDLAGGTPRTVFGFIVAALAERRRLGHGGFTVMSCDNLRGSGDTIRTGILAFANAQDPDLAAWIDANVSFPNGMVDRIAPQISEADRVALNEASGIADRVPATCEPYTNWVIEDRFCAGRPPFEKVGVTFSDDVAGHVEVKGRLSNAAHSLMSYPGLLLGGRLIDEAMRDPRIPQLLTDYWELDTYALVREPAGLSMRAFTASVLERFANPYIRDTLARVAGDGTSKFNIYHRLTIQQLVEKDADLSRIAFLFASFARYLGGVDDKGESFPVFEPRLSEADWTIVRSGPPEAVIGLSQFEGLGLVGNERFLARFREISDILADKGCGAALDDLLARGRAA